MLPLMTTLLKSLAPLLVLLMASGAVAGNEELAPAGQAPTTACNDGVDQNASGSADFPIDPECESPWDDLELSVRPGDLLISDTRAARIVRVDPRTGEQALVAEGGLLVAPQHLVATGDGLLYVADSGAGAVVEVNLRTGAQRIAAASALLSSAHGITVDADGAILVTNRRSPTHLISIDSVSGNATLRAALPADVLTGIAVLPDGDVVLGAEGWDNLFRVDARGHWLSMHDARGFDARGVAVDASGHVLVVDRIGSVIERIERERETVELWAGSVELDPEQMTVDADGSVLLVDRAGASVLRIDPLTGKHRTLSQGGLLTAPSGLTTVPAPAGEAI
jgi:streptogramin lyase